MIRAALRPLALAAACLAGPAAAFDIQDMTADEQDAFRAEVREYLLDNPEVLMEAISVLERRQAEQQEAGDAAMIAANSEMLFNDPTSWVGGNPEGSVTMVEFLDYRCGYCRRAHPEVSELVQSDGDIRLIVKEFPILGEQSVRASRFALAVRQIEGDAAYKTVSDALIATRGDITNQALRRLSRDLDLDFEVLSDAMEDPAIDEIIARNRALAQALQINGTPTFVFGDTMVRGYAPLEAMQEIVAEQREG